MGSLCFFDKSMPGRHEDGPQTRCTVEVLDNHSVPEIRIGPEGAANEGWVASFDNWALYLEFKEAVDSLYERLRRAKESA